MQFIKFMAAGFSAFAIVGLVGCGIAGIPGSGKLAKANREVGTFDQVSISGSGTIDIVAGGGDQTVEIETDDNLLELVQTEVIDGKLEIKFIKTAAPTKGLDVKIQVAHLKQLQIAGAYTANLDGIDEPNLKIEAAGSVKVIGKGKVVELSLESAGSSTIECGELAASKVHLEAAGSCKATVNATDELDVEIAGSGSVQYAGDPKVSKRIAGSGSVEKLQ